MRRGRAGAVTAFLIGVGVNTLLFINLCSLIYQCGCESLWASADAHCNIHTQSGKHCPICSIGMTGALGVYAAIVAAQALAVFSFGGPFLTKVARAVGAFPVAFVPIALVLGWWMEYWN